MCRESDNFRMAWRSESLGCWRVVGTHAPVYCPIRLPTTLQELPLLKVDTRALARAAGYCTGAWAAYLCVYLLKPSDQLEREESLLHLCLGLFGCSVLLARPCSCKARCDRQSPNQAEFSQAASVREMKIEALVYMPSSWGEYGSSRFESACIERAREKGKSLPIYAVATALL